MGFPAPKLLLLSEHQEIILWLLSQHPSHSSSPETGNASLHEYAAQFAYEIYFILPCTF